MEPYAASRAGNLVFAMRDDSNTPASDHADPARTPRRRGRGRRPRSGSGGARAGRGGRAQAHEERRERQRAARAARTPLLEYPPELPVVEHRAEIAEAIRDHQVVVIAGETGSGKIGRAHV